MSLVIHEDMMINNKIGYDKQMLHTSNGQYGKENDSWKSFKR